MDYILAYTLIHQVTQRYARQTPESDWYVDAAPRYRPTPSLWSRLRAMLSGSHRSASEPPRPVDGQMRPACPGGCVAARATSQ